MTLIPQGPPPYSNKSLEMSHLLTGSVFFVVFRLLPELRAVSHLAGLQLWWLRPASPVLRRTAVCLGPSGLQINHAAKTTKVPAGPGSNEDQTYCPSRPPPAQGSLLHLEGISCESASGALCSSLRLQDASLDIFTVYSHGFSIQGWSPSHQPAQSQP